MENNFIFRNKFPPHIGLICRNKGSSLLESIYIIENLVFPIFLLVHSVFVVV